MSYPLQFRFDGCPDAEDVADVRAELREMSDVVSADGSLDAHSDSDAEQDEPVDVRSFSHSVVLQTALQKNLSDPHFNPAHSKIKQPASILNDPLVSSLSVVTSDDVSSNGSSFAGHGNDRTHAAAPKIEQQRCDGMPSLSDENVTAGRWIGSGSCAWVQHEMGIFLIHCRLRCRATQQVPAGVVLPALQPHTGSSSNARGSDAEAREQTQPHAV
jgi:hypothetical protein